MSGWMPPTAGEGLRKARWDVVQAMEHLGVKNDSVATVAELVALRLPNHGHRERWVVASMIVSKEDRAKLGSFPAGPVFLVQDGNDACRVVTLDEMATQDWTASVWTQGIERFQ